MVSVLIFLFGVTILGGIVYMLGIREYDHYVFKVAEKYSIDDINRKIDDVKDLLEDNELSGQVFEDILDYMDFWENVKKAKLKLNEQKYEDIVS